MPTVSSYDVLAKTGKAVINGNGFDVCCDQGQRSVTLVGEYNEEQVEVPDQQASFCDDADGFLIVIDTNDQQHTIQCMRLVDLTMGDL